MTSVKIAELGRAVERLGDSWMACVSYPAPPALLRVMFVTLCMVSPLSELVESSADAAWQILVCPDRLALDQT